MLSVIIPTYNRSSLVVDAVASVLRQDGEQRLQTIVVDDGSVDNTREALQEFAGRITYRHQPNAGVNAARNTGVREANGEYVAFLDSDDGWLPFKTSAQLAVLEQLDVGFAFSNFFIWRDGIRIRDGLGSWMTAGQSIERCSLQRYTSTELGITSPEPFAVHVCDIYRLSLYQPVVLPSTSIIRRSVLNDLGPLSEDNWMCGDWEYFARASKRYRAAYLDVETTLNRSHGDSVRLMRRPLADRIRQRIESIRRTWRSDPQFMETFAHEVARVESDELRALFKLTCYEGDLADASEQLREIERLVGKRERGLHALWWLMRVPLVRNVVASIRRPP